ncbi:MAG: hypothetical protein C0509_06955 [Acinetobacter sp.]|nr:hypothetical protein [Acinetobacter sp.]
MDSFGNALGNDIVGRMTPAATAAPVTLAKNGQRAMDMDGVNFLDAGVDTSMPDMRWIDDLNTSIGTGSNLAVNANTPGYTATVSAASQTAVAGGYDGDPGMGTFTEITYNPNEQVMPEVVVTASAKESGGGLLSWLRKPENISFVLDMVPVVGSMKSIYQVFSGKDLITGESVNRWVEGASIVAGMAPAGKLGVKEIVGAVPNKAGTSGWTDLARDARAVVRDVEAHSGVRMSSNQRALLADELRHVDHTYIASRSDYQALQRQYSSQYNNLKREWEFNTGQIWPKTASGVDFQSHHVIPKQYGGPNQWWNLHPVPGGSAHQGGVHGIGSPTSKAFPQHPPRVR